MGMNAYYFRIDVYFTKYLSAVEIDEKNHAYRDLIFEEKHQEKNCEFIRINMSKRYDEDFKFGRIKTFISKFKDRQLRKLEKESNHQKNI